MLAPFYPSIMRKNAAPIGSDALFFYIIIRKNVSFSPQDVFFVYFMRLRSISNKGRKAIL